MNYLLRSCYLGLGVLVMFVLAGSARAEARYALDYRSAVKGCSSDRFPDEISAKLGFVPWDAQATNTLRVRISKDGRELVGTIEHDDGTTKVLRAASCAKLHEALISAISVALDSPTIEVGVVGSPSPNDERRLRKLERDPNELVTIEVKSRDGRDLEISRVIAANVTAVAYGGYLGGFATLSFEKLCKAPCRAQVPPGTNTFLVRDIVNDVSVRQDAEIRVNSTLEFDYTSQLAARKTTSRRISMGGWIGFVAGTAAMALYIESSDTPHRELHILDPLGGLTGSLVGAIIGRLVSPGNPPDKAQINVRPGLGTF
jgi:hypothetical protein